MRAHAIIAAAALPALLVIGCQTSPAAVNERQVSSPSAEDADVFPVERTAILWVKGLACPYCVHNVDRQLAALSGVERAHVDLPTGKVSVALAAERPATREQLAKAIDHSGFTLDRIEMPE